MRFGQIAKLKPEKKDEYIRLHANVWPEVMEVLKRYHISNYSIYNFDLFCFASFEYHGKSYQEDMAKMAADQMIQSWWKFTKPCFEQFEFAGKDDYYIDMKEIFRMD